MQKILTAAALIDSGTADADHPARGARTGCASGGTTIKDHFEHEELSYNMRGVIAKSSNIGTAMLTRQMPTEQLHDYLVSFGLGSRTGIELPGEDRRHPARRPTCTG